MPLHVRDDAVAVPETCDAREALGVAEQHARLATQLLNQLTTHDSVEETVRRAHAHATTSCAWTNVAWNLTHELPKASR